MDKQEQPKENNPKPKKLSKAMKFALQVILESPDKKTTPGTLRRKSNPASERYAGGPLDCRGPTSTLNALVKRGLVSLAPKNTKHKYYQLNSSN